MTQDFAEKDYADRAPWWISLFWGFAMAVCLYIWVWVLTGTYKHIECWNANDSMGCAVLWSANTDDHNTGE